MSVYLDPDILVKTFLFRIDFDEEIGIIDNQNLINGNL